MSLYRLNSFDPAFAGEIEGGGHGIMFPYGEPGFIASVIAENGGRIPDEVAICLTEESISLLVCFGWDEPEYDDFFLVGHQAGLDLLNWVYRECSHEVDQAEQAAYVQRLFLELAFNPINGGGIVLDGLSLEERLALHTHYESMSSISLVPTA